MNNPDTTLNISLEQVRRFNRALCAMDTDPPKDRDAYCREVATQITIMGHKIQELGLEIYELGCKLQEKNLRHL